MDTVTELPNAQLAFWNRRYVKNMTAAMREKQSKRAADQARKNAEFWVFGGGLGPVGSGVDMGNIPGPLQLFSGRALVDALGLSIPAPSNGTKREREDEPGSGSEGRRVRQRAEARQDQNQLGPGEQMFLDDDEMVRMMEDDVCFLVKKLSVGPC